MKTGYLTATALLFAMLVTTSVSAQVPDLRQILEKLRKSGSQPPIESQKQKPTEPVPNQSASTSANAGSGTYPCLSKVCLGDSIMNHAATIQWFDFSTKVLDLLFDSGPGTIILNGKGPKTVKQEAPTRRDQPAVKERRLWIDKHVKGLATEADKDKIAAYLVLERADRSLFDLLATKKPVFCRSFFLVASFTSESGYPTSVYISPTARGELRVFELRRWYPNSDPVEATRTRDAVLQQFPYLNYNSIVDRAPWGGNAEYLPFGSADKLTFRLASGELDGDRNLARQQGCESAKGAVD